MGNEIPTRSREKVRDRDGDQCQMCGSANNLAWHHRRRRGVKGHFQHCPCLGVQLCPTDHAAVHANPALARQTGMIISPYEDQPWTVPLRTFHGWVLNDCDGESEYTDDPIIETA